MELSLLFTAAALAVQEPAPGPGFDIARPERSGPEE